MSNYVKNAIGHTKTVLTHKKLVFKFMCMAGYPYGGLMHDMSKFHPEEFIESVKYYAGGVTSPIDKASKAQDGFSSARSHHRRNKHHLDYWLTNVSFKDVEPKATLIPKRYTVEMLCDWLAAGIVYKKDKWTWHTPVQYALEVGSRYRLHPVVFNYLLYMFRKIEEEESFECLKEAKKIYDIFVNQK